MPDGWESVGITDITIPGDAGPADPRIYIGQNDEIARGVSQDAAIVLYFGLNRAFLISVEQSGGPDFGQLHIWSVDNNAGTLFQYIDIDHDVLAGKGDITLGADGPTSNDTSSHILGEDVEIYGGRNIQLKSDLIEIAPTVIPGDVTLYDEPIGRWVNGNGIVANSAAIGVNETTVITIPAMDYKANHAYRVDITGMVTASVAPNNPVLRVRKTNPAGQQFQANRVSCPNGATPFPGGFSAYFRVGAADVNATIVVTLVGSAAFNAVLTAAATSPATADVFVIGDGTARTWIPTLV